MRFGEISGSVDGSESIVYDNEISGSPVTTFSTGNILARYGSGSGFFMICRLISGATSSVARLRLNADSGNNYGVRGTSAVNTSVADWASSTTSSIYLTSAPTNGNSGLCVLRILPKIGLDRKVMGTQVYNISGTSVNGIIPFGGVWTDSINNLLSMDFLNDAANGYGVGSHVIILKQNSFTNATNCGAISTPYIKGSWVRVGSSILGSPATSIPFTVNGDRDVFYILKGAIRTASSTAAHHYITFNSDGGSNYGFQYLNMNNTTISAATGASTSINTALNTDAQNTYRMFKILIYAKSGYVRPLIIETMRNITGTTVTESHMAGHVWNNTVDNLIDITLASTQTNGIDTGSQVELYALRPNG